MNLRRTVKVTRTGIIPNEDLISALQNGAE